MRRVILVEGKAYPDKSFWDAGSLEFPKDTVPVAWVFHFNDKKKELGTARDFQREPDGTITAELDILDEYQQLMSNMSVRIYAINVTSEKDKKSGANIIHHADLKGLGVVVEPPWHPGYPDE